MQRSSAGRWRHAVVAGGVVCAVATTTVPMHAAAAAADTPAIRQAMSIAKPAVVFIYVQIQGSLLDQRDGQVHGPYVSSSKGSGFFVNPNGDLVTATHVVSPTLSDIQTALVDRYIIAVTGTQVATNDPLFLAYARATRVENVSLDARVITQAMHIPPKSTNADLDRLGLPATTVASSPVDQLDVSVLHVDRGQQPAVLVQGGGLPAPGSSLALMGYPQQAPLFSVVPDVTYGLLTGVQTTGGVPTQGVVDIPRQAVVIVTSAFSEHGDSGGPGVDTKANVVGLVSFGAIAGTPIFLVSAQDIAGVLAQGHVTNALSDADQRWRAGVTAQHHGDVKTALADFRACAAQSPDNTGCQQAIAQLAAGSTSASGPPLALLVGGAVLLALVLTGSAALVLGRRAPAAYE